MKKLRTTGWFFFLVILLVALVSMALAQDEPAATTGQLLQHESLAHVSLDESSEEVQTEFSATDRHSLSLSTTTTVSLAPAGEKPVREADSTVIEGAVIDTLPSSEAAEPELEKASRREPLDFSGQYVGLGSDSYEPDAASDVCNQLLKNTKLTVTSGSFAPWVILDAKVYYTSDTYTSSPHSVFMEDQDSGDPSPGVDAFAQVITVPNNPTDVEAVNKIVIRYQTASLNSNDVDYTGGAVWTVNSAGDLQDYVTDWHVRDAPDAWKGRIFEITDSSVISKIAGKKVALIFFTDTNNAGDKELVLFDDVTLEVCYPDPPNSYITVKKKVSPTSSAQRFEFNPSWSGTNFKLGHNESTKSRALNPGTYNVKEIVPSGWKQESVKCSDGSSPNSISLQKGETVTCTFTNKKIETVQTCGQVLVNTKLDVIEFGDGFGQAEPWVFPWPIVYYTKNPSTAYDGFSLLVKDGDPDDPNPGGDMLAQGFQMPGNLTKVEIEFRRATVNTNNTDKAYVELWKLDDNWVLHLDQWEKYYVAGTSIVDSDGTWGKQIATVPDASLVNAMSGQKMAIILFSITDGGGSKKERVYFDNIMLTACSKGAPAASRIFMPVTMKKFGKASGPICAPPVDNPLDQWHSDRGFVQTGAYCNSTLSPADKADYYTFKPTKSGNHTLRLTNLPAGTEWSSMIFTDTASPAYAPGGASDGKCRITQPGSGNKQVVCNLNKGTGYFVKVSAGSTPANGSYRMRITSP